MTLTGRRIVVTGGASGMGAAMVRDFVREGAAVVSLDRDEASNAEVARSVEGPGRATPMACDVTDRASVEQAFATATTALGGLDALVHAAGIAPGAPAEAITLELWEEVFAVNSRGTFLTNVAAFPYLKDKGGRILNFSSGAGIRGYPGKAAYAAAKGAVLAWVRSIAVEWAPYRITVNAISPAIWTPMYEKTRSLMTPQQLETHERFIAERIPLGGRLGDPDRDFAPVMRFLVGEGSAFLTGQTFAIDGGMTMVR